MSNLITDLPELLKQSLEKQHENDAFRVFVKNKNGKEVDAIVHELNDQITPQIDCTQCGNCCRNLMINITPEEAITLSLQLNMELPALKEKYIEESMQGQLIMNTIPCHFLSGSSCSIYSNRFTECREFPHLHKDNFQDRLFGLLIHYATCPIIFNVVEVLKERLDFKL